jgi:hypothetical protein
MAEGEAVTLLLQRDGAVVRITPINDFSCRVSVELGSLRARRVISTSVVRERDWSPAFARLLEDMKGELRAGLGDGRPAMR